MSKIKKLIKAYLRSTWLDAKNDLDFTFLIVVHLFFIGLLAIPSATLYLGVFHDQWTYFMNLIKTVGLTFGVFLIMSGCGFLIDWAGPKIRKWAEYDENE